jgi:transcription factor MYB, plant
VKNYWNTKLSKKLRQRGIDPLTHRPIADLMHSIGALAIRPPQPATSPNGSAAYLPAPALPLVHDVAYHAAGMLPPTPAPQRQVVIARVEADAPASPTEHGHELKWSDFLADDAAAAAAAAAEAQQQLAVVGQYHHEANAGSSSAAAGGNDGCGIAVGGDDGAAAFIDAILDCDKETGVDQLIAELLADPAYYAGSSSSSSSSSGMGWAGMGLLNAD